MNNDLEEYKQWVQRLGFQEVLALPFTGKYPGDEDYNEMFMVYFRKKGGVLLSLDTYHGKLNRSNIYYNWKPNGKDYHRVTSSGGWHWTCPPELEVPYSERYDENGRERDTPEIKKKDEARNEHFRQNAVWYGDHDARSNIDFSLKNLEKHGEFVTPWVKKPHLWLLHYMDTKDDRGKPLDWKEVSARVDKVIAERLAMLPPDVQAALGK